MKTTIKFFPTIILVITISYSSAFACGEMGNGSRDCGIADGDGLIAHQPTVTNTENDEKNSDTTQNKTAEDSVLKFIQDFLVNFFA